MNARGATEALERLRAVDGLRARWRVAVSKHDRIGEFSALALVWAVLEAGYDDLVLHDPETARTQLGWLSGALSWLAEESPGSQAIRDLQGKAAGLWLRYPEGGTA